MTVIPFIFANDIFIIPDIGHTELRIHVFARTNLLKLIQKPR